MKFKNRTLEQIADMICGNDDKARCFKYRSSTYLTQFFIDIGMEYVHNGSTRKWWVLNRIEDILSLPKSDELTPPPQFLKLINSLMDLEDAQADDPDRNEALSILNKELKREGFEAYYSEDGNCYLRQIGRREPLGNLMDPHRPLTPEENSKREKLESYLSRISEDELIEQILLPMFRQLGFHCITPAGHKDKALEYGTDIWMKYKLPTQHYLYFGIQVKKGKLDSSGVTKNGNVNMSEVFNQVLMMLGKEIFDPEISKRVLVDHAFIVAGGEITKAARSWLGNNLDVGKRSQILFMDRSDILNLYVVTNLPLPVAANPVVTNKWEEDELPF